MEDEARVRALVEATLARGPYDVQAVATAGEALAVAASWAPELVLLDIGLPDGDGLAVCRQLKAAANGSPRIVFLTAMASAADRRLGLEAGGDGYLTKPFSPRQLLTYLAELLA